MLGQLESQQLDILDDQRTTQSRKINGTIVIDEIDETGENRFIFFVKMMTLCSRKDRKMLA